MCTTKTFHILILQLLNEQFNGQLETAIDIFTDEYPKRFLHQLVSGQLDVDRMDYLTRDSFFTGVVGRRDWLRPDFKNADRS